MSDFQDLFSGLKMFNDGVQQYATSKAIGDATEQVNNLNTTAMSEQEQSAERAKIGQSMAMRLQQVGAPQERIQGAVSAVGGPQYATPEAMTMAGVNMGKQNLVDQGLAAEAQLGAVSRQMAIEKAKAASAEAIAAASNATQLKTKYMELGAKGGSAPKAIEPSEQAKIEADMGILDKLDQYSQVASKDDYANIGPLGGRTGDYNIGPRSQSVDASAIDRAHADVILAERKGLNVRGFSPEAVAAYSSTTPPPTSRKDVLVTGLKQQRAAKVNEITRHLMDMGNQGFNVSPYLDKIQKHADVGEPRVVKTNDGKEVTVVEHPVGSGQYIQAK